jgi:hypothetical protein
MATPKKNSITELTLRQIEKLGEIVREQRELSRRFEQLRDEYLKLHTAVQGARGALRFASEQGVIPVDEFQEVQNALIRLEAAETGIPLPPGHPAVSEPAKPRTLLEVLDTITAGIPGEFRAGDARRLLEPHKGMLKREPHPASIAGALRDLAKAGKLELVSGGGRGNEATYKRIEPAGKLVNGSATS